MSSLRVLKFLKIAGGSPCEVANDFAFLGLLMGLNLWFGLYSAPGEWPWTYGFLIIVQMLFIIDPPGRCLGLDDKRRR